MTPTPLKTVVMALAATALGGCVSLPSRGDDAAVAALLAERQGPAAQWSMLAAPAHERRAIDALLAEPMTLDCAVRIALLRSPRLQAEYARLGLERAEVLEAVQIENPNLQWWRLSLSPDGGHERGLSIELPLVDLLTLPLRARMARAEHTRLRLEMAATLLDVGADIEAAWYTQVAAEQIAQMRVAVAEGAATSAELAQRFFAAGNISELQLKQEQAVASQARIDAARARAEALQARLALNTLLGLSGDEADWRNAAPLPLPVSREDTPKALLALARDHNLELLAARQQAESAADVLGLTRQLRWLGGSGIGFERESDSAGERKRGPSLSLQLPLFHRNQAEVAKARAQLDAALARVNAAELAIEHGVMLGSQQVTELSKAVALHRDALIPQRETVVARSLQEYNFMLIGAFELIRAKLDEYDAYQGYVESVRDYWLARVELMRALGQRLPSDAGISGHTPTLEQILKPAGEASDPHQGHHAHPSSAAPAMEHSQHQGHQQTPTPPKQTAPVEPEQKPTEDEHAHHHHQGDRP